ncbi:MAG: hypothetical protein EPO06_08655 [Burkholderiaceae bacterium]|nr:MAG: hypothetical protein EPO06_08655 [Burkholderiaceae bacterium]
MDIKPRLITEEELRTAVRSALSIRAQQDGFKLYEELTIENKLARVDFALVGDKIEGFELKSDFDNFSRLHNQIHAYNRVFDRITIITCSVCAGGALDVLPKWWGVVLTERQASGLEFRELRPAQDNPLQDPYSVAALLWRDEACALLQQHSSRVPAKASRNQLYEQMVDELSWDQLRTSVARLLLQRDEAVIV